VHLIAFIAAHPNCFKAYLDHELRLWLRQLKDLDQTFLDFCTNNPWFGIELLHEDDALHASMIHATCSKKMVLGVLA
jgi:hypothetical protein